MTFCVGELTNKEEWNKKRLFYYSEAVVKITELKSRLTTAKKEDRKPIEALLISWELRRLGNLPRSLS